MLILIVFILLLIWVALTYNVYSIFKPFMENLWNIQHYNIAYYGAISSIERAELVLRYHVAWFGGSWWWIWSTDIWPSSDWKISNFWLLSKWNNWILWQIHSRVNWNTLPQPWNWNIDYDLRRTWNQYWWSSSWYNKLDYNLSEEFLLFIDKSRENNSSNLYKIYSWYKNADIENIKPNAIKVILRLPPKISDILDGNEDNNPNAKLAKSIDLDWDWINDDIIVNRSLFWIDSNWNEFTILPTIDVNYDSSQVEDWDTAIRESIINKPTNWTSPNICFGNNSDCSSIGWDKNPVQDKNKPDYHNIIPSDSPFSWQNFKSIFQNWSKLHLKFSIVNLMKDNNNKIFPFLEYKLIFDWISTISDRFFHIKWIWKVGDYKVIIHIEKPVVKSTAASDFTILF